MIFIPCFRHAQKNTVVYIMVMYENTQKRIEDGKLTFGTL